MRLVHFHGEPSCGKTTGGQAEPQAASPPEYPPLRTLVELLPFDGMFTIVHYQRCSTDLPPVVSLRSKPCAGACSRPSDPSVSCQDLKFVSNVPWQVRLRPCCSHLPRREVSTAICCKKRMVGDCLVDIRNNEDDEEGAVGIVFVACARKAGVVSKRCVACHQATTSGSHYFRRTIIHQTSHQIA